MDAIFRSFLKAQYTEGMQLAESTDLMSLQPLDADPTRRYLVEFRCRGLAMVNDEIVERDRWRIHIFFHDDYLRRIRPERIVSLLTPAFHPNTYGHLACLGNIRAGTSLVDICYQLYGMLSYQELRPREDDALNHRACMWARQRMSQFPLDPRPLVWRADETAVALGGD